jgi:GNAT superfamily N-acetyltransferase
MLRGMTNLVERAYRTYSSRLALGHEQLRLPNAVASRDRALSDIYEANFVARVRAQTPAEIASLLGELEEVFAGSDHRLVLWDPQTPAAFEAQLVLDGFRPHNELVMLALEGELRRRGPEVSIRAAVSEADVRSLADMHWLDHQEEFTLGFHPPWDRAVTERFAAAKRQKAPDVRYFIADIDGVDCGFFSAWGGVDGVGQVEDLFTRPEFRGRGIGTALVAHCVDDARAHGAEVVLVAPRADDTPKQMYLALGFRPLCVQRSYLKHLEAGA